MEHEINGTGPLLDEKGRLREPGWAKGLILDYDRKAIKAPANRIKEWDYYCILAGDMAFAFTIADNGYMGMLSVSVLDLSAKEQVTESPMTLLPMGKMGLPTNSASGVSEAHVKDLSLRFEAKDGVRTIAVRWPSFGAASKGRAARLFGIPTNASQADGTNRTNGANRTEGSVGIEADIVLREKAPRESMVIATPFARAPRAFYYNQKINCQDAEGKVRVGAREFTLAPGLAFAVLDWGRGVWTWKNTWLWGSSSGLATMAGSKQPISFGFNIGYGFGDTSAASENMAFVEGKAHKIGRLTIDLDDKDFMKPWHAKSEDGRFDLTLHPVLDRKAADDYLLIASIQHQVFGLWSGSVVLEDGRKVEVEDLVGFCEKVKNRW